MTLTIAELCSSLCPAILAQAGGAPAGGTQAGDYVNIYKIAGMIALAVPWLLACPWVQKDSKHVRASKTVWSSTILLAGGLTFMLWLLIPSYLTGLLVYALAVLATLISYVVYRNGRVEEDERIGLGALLKSGQGKVKEKVLVRLKIYGPGNKIMPEPDPQATDPTEVHAYNLTQELLYDMIWRRASEADIAPAGEQARVRFVIDGVAVDRPPRSLGESEAIIQYLKTAGGMQGDDRRRPQKGKIAIDAAGNQTEISLTSAGTTGGQRMHFRVVKEFVQTQLDELGMSKEVLAKIRELTRTDHGLFIVSGTPGSGLTSSLYSLLREQDAFVKQLVTLEAKVDVDMENITQMAYAEPAALPHALAGALRRDPDVVMVDQCQDGETAKLIADASAEKFILLGMHAPDSFTVLAKWLKAAGGQRSAVENLRGVMCQMLLRKLCPNCRESYKPDPLQLAKANIPAENIDMFYRPTGKLVDEKGKITVCPVCQGSGYFGRGAAFELLEMTPELSQLIVAGASLSQIKAAARKKNMLYLQEQAFSKVIAGETSIEELIRVSKQKKS